jgi:3',5'-cyclic AMP phosphodiesterase CpdA
MIGKRYTLTFNTEDEYSTFKASDKFNIPNVSYIKESGAVHYSKYYEEFVFFSDPHVFTAETRVEWSRDIHLDRMKEYFNVCASKFIICGGDWLWAHEESIAEQDLQLANSTMLDMFGDKYYPVLGNHDINDEGSAPIPDATLTSLLFSRWGKRYYTIQGLNTKFYVFDTGSSLAIAMNSYRYEQVKWFCNSLLNNNDKHIAIVMHMAQTGENNGTPVTCPMAQIITSAANAFNTRSSYTVDGTTYKFNGKTGKVHIVFAGHWHQDNNYIYNNIPIYIIDDARTGNFDIITLDYKSNVLNSTRIGTGNNRTVTLA